MSDRDRTAVVSALTSLLHDAADRVAVEAGEPHMDVIAEAGAQFLRESNVTGSNEERLALNPVSVGYGIMLGYVLREECDK